MHSSSATINPAKSTKSKPSQWKEKSVGMVPASVQAALREALAIESVSPTQYGDFLWLIAQESGGVVGVRNAPVYRSWPVPAPACPVFPQSQWGKVFRER
jgi:hypothetical protein